MYLQKSLFQTSSNLWCESKSLTPESQKLSPDTSLETLCYLAKSIWEFLNKQTYKQTNPHSQKPKQQQTPTTHNTPKNPKAQTTTPLFQK